MKINWVLPAAALVIGMVIADLALRDRANARAAVEPPSDRKGDTRLGARALTALEPRRGASLAVEIAGPQSRMLDQIIAENGPSTRNQALALLEALPNLPAEQRLEACQDALIRLDDESYHPAFELLLAGGTAPDLREAIMSDLMGRPEFLHLPYLVRIASLEQHPFREDAHIELVNAIGDDYGSNWLGWSDAIAAHLESQPEAVKGVELLQ